METLFANTSISPMKSMLKRPFDSPFLNELMETVGSPWLDRENPPSEGSAAAADLAGWLMGFCRSFQNIPIRVAGGPSIGVWPPYFINRDNGRKQKALENRQKAPAAVSKILNSLPSRARVGKSFPEDIQSFLEQSITQKELPANSSSQQLREFLVKYGIGVDCSGFVCQALNTVMRHKYGRELQAHEQFDWKNRNAASLRGGQHGLKKVRTPNDLRSGDTMWKSGHIRLVLKAEKQGNAVVFSTIESTSIADLGPRIAFWKYPDGAALKDLQLYSETDKKYKNYTKTTIFGRYSYLSAPPPPGKNHEIEEEFEATGAVDTSILPPTDSRSDYHSSHLTWRWEADAAKEQFMRDVYEAHVRSKQTRPFVARLHKSVLGKIDGTAVHKGILPSLTAMLDAMQEAARQAGRDDIKVIVGSGYRSAKTQLELWNKRFLGYYNKAVNAGSITDGDYSAASAKKMAAFFGARTGAPGYSNHQPGNAIDFKGKDGKNSLEIDFEKQGVWRKSFFWKWMTENDHANSKRFQFNPIKTETWHWEYSGKLTGQLPGGSVSSSSQSDSDSAGTSSSESTRPDRSEMSRLLGYDTMVFEFYVQQKNHEKALEMAISNGISDENVLTNLLFFGRHYDMAWRGLRSDEKSFIAEWVKIRDEIVRPFLKKKPAGAGSSSTASTASAGGLASPDRSEMSRLLGYDTMVFEHYVQQKNHEKALEMATEKGISDENVLTNLVFFGRHYDMAWRGLRSDEKSFIVEWVKIRDEIVRPFLKKKPAVSGTSPTVSKPSGGSAAMAVSSKVTVKQGSYDGMKGVSTSRTVSPRTDQIKDGDDIIAGCTSEVEGGFDTVNMYDKGIVSWGIMQWTVHAGSFQKMLAYFKKQLEIQGKSSLMSLFGGLDTDPKGNLLFNGQSILTDESGLEAMRLLFRGDADPALVRYDWETATRWATTLALAGRNPTFQRLQMDYTRNEINRACSANFGQRLLDLKDSKSLGKHVKPIAADLPNYHWPVSDYVNGSLKARMLFFGMWTNNPFWSFKKLYDAIKVFEKRRSLSGSPTAWETGWQEGFADTFEEVLRATTVAYWGDAKAAGDGRTSRTSKLINQFNKLVASTGISVGSSEGETYSPWLEMREEEASSASGMIETILKRASRIWAAVMEMIKSMQGVTLKKAVFHSVASEHKTVGNSEASIREEQVKNGQTTYVRSQGKGNLKQGSFVILKAVSPDNKFGKVCSVRKNQAGQFVEDGLIGWTSMSNLVNGWADHKSENAEWRRGNYIGQIDLIEMKGTKGPVRVSVEMFWHFNKLRNAAALENLSLTINSGFRNYAEQVYFYNGYKAGKPGFNKAARPGRSNHQHGQALDLNTEGFGSKKYEWLKKNGPGFGFIRTVSGEAWHWEYRPADAKKYGYKMPDV